jgi:hypothetical protein
MCLQIALAAEGFFLVRPQALSSDNKRLTITGLQPGGKGFAIFPSVSYTKSSICLPANPDSEFPRLDSYSPLALHRPGFPS